MIAVTSNGYQNDAKVHVLKSDYKVHRLDICAEAVVAGDYQSINFLKEYRIHEILPASGIGAVYYNFHMTSGFDLHLFSYNLETNSCERAAKLLPVRKSKRRIGTTAYFLWLKFVARRADFACVAIIRRAIRPRL